jgi:hypothetical protein
MIAVVTISSKNNHPNLLEIPATSILYDYSGDYTREALLHQTQTQSDNALFQTQTQAAVSPTLRVSNIDKQSTAQALEIVTLPPSLTPTPTNTPVSSIQAAIWTSTALAQFHPSITPAANDSGMCGWQWARQPLPDAARQVQTRFDTARIKYTNVYAEAYGENCLNGDGSVRYFAAMTSDLYITLSIESLDDTDALANVVVSIYQIISTPPPANLPARPGYLDITFQSGSQSRKVRAMFSDYQSAIEHGLTGAALLKALGG